MADNNTLNIRLKPCAHTSTEWASDTHKNKVLLDGEIGYEKDTGRYKIGDGTKKWAELDWAKATPYGDFIPLNTSGGIGSINGGGKYWHCLIATIKISNIYINRPITFEISGRGFLTSIVQVMFQSADNTDPGLGKFTTNGYNNFYIVKSDTSTWKIYGTYTEVYGNLVLHRITGSGSNIGVTVNLENVDALPTGTTKASYYGNVSYATNAGSATQANKLTVNAGSSTNPVYFSGGVPTACSGRTVPGIKSASEVTTLGWGTNNNYVADISLLSYWNGAYSGTSSNLAYCKQGAFGTIVTKAAGDYLAVSGTAVAAKKLVSAVTLSSYDFTPSTYIADGGVVGLWNNNSSTDSNGYPAGNSSGGILFGRTNAAVVMAARAGQTVPTIYVKQYYQSWGDWALLLHSSNYTSYTVKKDGTGASGTWGINISGNAATATNATNASSATTAYTGRHLPIAFYGSNTAGTAGWYKVGTFSQSGHSDYNLNLLITSGYSRQAQGLLHIHTRCNNSTTIGIQTIKWMYRYGFEVGHVYAKDNGNNTWSLYVYQSNNQHGRVQVQILTQTGTAASQYDLTLTSNGTPETSAPTGGTAATDGGISNQANTLAKARTINGTSFDGSANITTANWGTARTLTIGDTGKSVNGSGNVSWTSSEVGYRHEWSCIVTCSTWSRLCYVTSGNPTIGASFLLNIGATRGSVVYNDTFIIKTHHHTSGKIIKISGHNYSLGYQVRLLVDTYGHCYVELYDNINGVTSSTTQTVYCRLIPIYCDAITKYTSFTSGTSLPSGFSVTQTMTLDNNDIQANIAGNLYGNATTATRANTVLGSYTHNGGQQNPNYFGTNKVGFLMMDTIVNGNSQYKDWMIMDCYNASDVGGGVAFGVNRQSLGAYIMRSDAARTSWAQSAELLGTHNYSSYALPLTGGTLSGALNLANGTWNKAGDDAYFGDNNTAGSFAIKGINGATNLKMVTYGGSTYGTITWDGSNFNFSNTIVGNLSGNASSAGYVTSDNSMRLYAQHSNEINFGGTNSASSIYFGYRAVDTKPIPSTFYFGGSTGTATLVAAKFKGALEGNADSATKLNLTRTIGNGNDSHATALQNEFNGNKASISRNNLNTYYSGAYDNGSFYMGYFLSGYNSNPYGGFFVAHYNDPFYVGITNGSFYQQRIITSANFSLNGTTLTITI